MREGGGVSSWSYSPWKGPLLLCVLCKLCAAAARLTLGIMCVKGVDACITVTHLAAANLETLRKSELGI